MQPTSQNVIAGGQTFSITMTNQGPGIAHLVGTTTLTQSIAQVTQHNCELGTNLAPGQSCTVVATSLDVAQVPKGTIDYVVETCANCQVTALPPPFQNFRGAATRIVQQ
jgi:hypothetical protein